MQRVEPHDPAERLSADDQATRREAEFLERALLRQMIDVQACSARRRVCELRRPDIVWNYTRSRTRRSRAWVLI